MYISSTFEGVLTQHRSTPVTGKFTDTCARRRGGGLISSAAAATEIRLQSGEFSAIRVSTSSSSSDGGLLATAAKEELLSSSIWTPLSSLLALDGGRLVVGDTRMNSRRFSSAGAAETIDWISESSTAETSLVSAMVGADNTELEGGGNAVRIADGVELVEFRGFILGGSRFVESC